MLTVAYCISTIACCICAWYVLHAKTYTSLILWGIGTILMCLIAHIVIPRTIIGKWLEKYED